MGGVWRHQPYVCECNKIKENMKLNSYWMSGKDEMPNSIYVLKWTLKWTINPNHHSIRMDAMHGEMKDSRSTRIVRCVMSLKFEFNSNSRWWVVVMKIRVQGGCWWEFEFHISFSPHIQLELITMDGEIKGNSSSSWVPFIFFIL